MSPQNRTQVQIKCLEINMNNIGDGVHVVKNRQGKFHEKPENGQFTAEVWHCRQKRLKSRAVFFFVRLRQTNFISSNECYTCSSITFSGVNQSWPGFVVLFSSLPLPSSSTSRLTFLMFKVVFRTGTTVTRTASIPSFDAIAFLRSAGVPIEWPPLMYSFTSITWSALLS